MTFIKKYRSVFESLAALFIQKMVDLILPLLIIPYFISKVGVNNYGIYAFANSIFIYLLNVTEYGFALSAVRDISINRNNPEEVNRIYNRVLTTDIFILLITTAIVSLLIAFIPSIRQDWILYLFIVFMLLGNVFNPNWLFYGIEKMRFITISSLTLKSTFIILVFIFIRHPNDYKYITICQSVGYLTAGLLGFFISIKKFGMKPRLVPFKEVLKELKTGFSSFLNLVSPSLYTNTAVFVVGVYCLPLNVAMIQVGVVVVGIFSALNTIMTNALFPFLNKNKDNFEKAKNIFLLTGTFFSIIMYLLSPIVLKIWIGHKFSAGNYDSIVNVVRLFSLSPFLMSVVSAYGVSGLLIHRKDKLFSIITIVSTMSCLLFAFILTPLMSLMGAGLAIILGRLIYSSLSFYYYNRMITTNLSNDHVRKAIV